MDRLNPWRFLLLASAAVAAGAGIWLLRTFDPNVAGSTGNSSTASGFIDRARGRSPCTRACRARVRPQPMQ